MCVQNLKFVALPVPEILGVLKNLGSPWIRLYPPFSVKFLMGLKSVALPVPEIIAIAVLGWGCEPQSLGMGGRIGGGDGTVRKSVCDFL